MSNNRKIIIIIIGLIVILALGIYIYSTTGKSSCNCLLYNISNEEVNNTVASYKNMTTDEVKTEVDSGKDITLLDVRTEAEYNQGHIPGSIVIPVDELQDRALNELPDKEAEIIVYCRSGARSASACDILVNLGYTNIDNMLGGISSWKYETEQ